MLPKAAPATAPAHAPAPMKAIVAPSPPLTSSTSFVLKTCIISPKYNGFRPLAVLQNRMNVFETRLNYCKLFGIWIESFAKGSAQQFW
jgi:hypothetical protein